MILTADLGGSSLRVALLGRDGAIAAMHAVPHVLGAEADPEDWWRGFVAGVEALPAADVARAEAVAVTAFTRSLVLLDDAGAVLRPAMLWTDARAESVVEEVRAMLPAHAEAAQVNAFHPLARLCWLARAEPLVVARAAVALEPKDEINRRLTGVAVSDVVSSARLAASQDLFAPLGLPDLLPPLRRPGAVMGLVREGLPGALAALAGRPVLAMANDTWAATTGLGAMRSGMAYCISGTTEVLGLLHDAPARAEGLLTVDWDGLWQLGGPSMHGADAVAWVQGVVASEAPPPSPSPACGGGNVSAEEGGAGDPLPLLFLPTLAGERVPHWDPSLRGAFLGLRRDHTFANLVRAVMQGVALNNATVLWRAEAAAGRVATELRLGGGGATPDWAQLRADVLGRDVVLTDAPEPGLLGCAITAIAALDRRPLAEIQFGLARPTRRFAPDPARHAAYRELHAIFARAEAAVAPISRALAALG
ncbi:xylulokinase [Falsiroseomonas sp. HW251]|uniref:xylulokinase n=1 Tax=Falsiroseomonas sp. HW251 TaxID=3390998 RepID=UPI003D312318